MRQKENNFIDQHLKSFKEKWFKELTYKTTDFIQDSFDSSSDKKIRDIKDLLNKEEASNMDDYQVEDITAMGLLMKTEDITTEAVLL